MKTLSEIKETIELTKHHLSYLKSLKYTKSLDSYPPGVEEAEGWINALEWVLDDYYEQKISLEEDFSLLTGCLIEETTRQDQK